MYFHIRMEVLANQDGHDIPPAVIIFTTSSRLQPSCNNPLIALIANGHFL